jgi:hypothetical protein
MSRLSFTHPALLGGLALVAIPILIHLLFRRPRRQMRFSTIQFFLGKAEEASRRRKIRHWLLLLTRCLLLMLLVLAFARPSLRDNSSTTARPPRDVVLVLDRSASMRARDRWTTALAKANHILENLSFADRAAVIEAAAPAKILSPLVPPSKARIVLKDLTPGFGSGDLAEGLSEAVRMLKETGAERETAIAVISDFQRQSAGNAKEIKVPEHTDLRLEQVGEIATPNIALRKLSLDPNGSVRIEISAFGEGMPSVVDATVLVDGKVYTNGPIAVASTSSRVLALPTLNSGWHTIEARLAADASGNPEMLDSLAADDRRWLAVEVPKALRVLVAEPRPSQQQFEEESFFVTSVLASAAVNRIPLRCDKVPADRLLSALSTVQDSAVVIIPGLHQPSERLGIALRDVVARGGGLVLFLGEEVVAARYEKTFGELLPMDLGQIEGDIDRPEEFWHLGDFDSSSPAFAAFQPENSGDPTRPSFSRRFTIARGTGVVARFADGVPFLAMKQLGQGHIVLVNTSPNTAWTDWPKRRTFVPWLEGVLAMAAGHPLRGTISPAPEVICGTENRVPVSSASIVRLRGPGKILEFQPQNGVIAVQAEQPGVYEVEKNNPGQEFAGFTASIPEAESDLAGMTTQEFLQSIKRIHDVPGAGPFLGLSSAGSRELWRFFLLGGLVFLATEFLLANRTWA